MLLRYLSLPTLIFTVDVAVAFTLPKNSRPTKALSSSFQPSQRRRLGLSSSVSANEELQAGILAIDNANEQIMSQLGTVIDAVNLRLFSVDILASCEYMPQELFECYSETCEIYPVDEEEVRSFLFAWPTSLVMNFFGLFL